MFQTISSLLVPFLGRTDRPTMDFGGAEALARSLREPAPEEGTDFATLLLLALRCAEKGGDFGGPGFMGFIPGGSLVASAVGEFLARATNRYATFWYGAPALAQMEATVVRWFADLFGFPAEARGVLTTGGSMANFTALVTARRCRLGEDLGAARLYLSDQAHDSNVRGAILAGLPERSVRRVPTTAALKMDVARLRELVRRDREAGHHPFCVVATAGTTNTGVVDPLAEIAEVAHEESLWLHVDAAYGGFFQLTARGAALLRGAERADSLTLDPHKALFLPLGTGCLLVRQGTDLKDAHRVSSNYLHDLPPEGDIPNFSEYSLELSREARGLRVWLPIKLHGLSAFRTALDRALDLARLFHAGLSNIPGLEVPWEPELSTVVFRHLPSSGEPDDHNARLLERLNASKRIFLSSTLLQGSTMLRACILSPLTGQERVEEALEIIRRSVLDVSTSG